MPQFQTKTQTSTTTIWDKYAFSLLSAHPSTTYQTLQIPNQDCKNTNTNQDPSNPDNYDKIARGDLITKHKDTCLTTYTQSLTDNGESPLGIPTNFYSFSFYPIDLAGNYPEENLNGTNTDSNETNGGDVAESLSFQAGQQAGQQSTFSRTLSIFHDIQAPQYHEVTNMESPSYSPIINYSRQQAIQEPTPNQTPITKDTSITSSHYGERQADIEYILTTPNNYQFSIFTRNGKNPQNLTDKGNQTINLTNDYTQEQLTNQNQKPTNTNQTTPNPHTATSNTRDEDRTDKNCTTQDPTNPTRRIGTCNDGIYQLQTRFTDTAGNQGELTAPQYLERDTVAPSRPVVQLSKNGDIFAEYLALNISGESYTKAVITIKSGVTRTQKVVTLNGNGSYSTSDLLGQLACGEITYTVTVTLTDRAGNISKVSIPQSVTTKECPRCMGGNKEGWQNPIHNPRSVRITAKFGSDNGGPNYDYPDHTGLDINVGPGIDGEPIYAAKEGKVRAIGTTGNYGNNVIIDHGNGFLTRYGHFKYAPEVEVGQIVDRSTILGRLGTTGNSSGPHLHFEVIYNWEYQNPEEYINVRGSNLTGTDYWEHCESESTEGFGGYPKIEQAQANLILERFEIDNDSYLDNYLGENRPAYDGDPKNWCDIWWEPAQYSGGRPTAGLFINPYPNSDGQPNDVYLIGGSIFEKYYNMGGPCSVVGVPKSFEQWTETNGQSVASDDEAKHQFFERGNYKNNTIYSYKDKSSGRKNYFVVNQVANKYAEEGRTTGKYGVPVFDTSGKNYCRQVFEGGTISFCLDDTGLPGSNPPSFSYTHEFVDLKYTPVYNPTITFKINGSDTVSGTSDYVVKDGGKVFEIGYGEDQRSVLSVNGEKTSVTINGENITKTGSYDGWDWYSQTLLGYGFSGCYSWYLDLDKINLENDQDPFVQEIGRIDKLDKNNPYVTKTMDSYELFTFSVKMKKKARGVYLGGIQNDLDLTVEMIQRAIALPKVYGWATETSYENVKEKVNVDVENNLPEWASWLNKDVIAAIVIIVLVIVLIALIVIEVGSDGLTIPILGGATARIFTFIGSLAQSLG